MGDESTFRPAPLRSALAVACGAAAVAVSFGSAIRADAAKPAALAAICEADTVVRVAAPERRIPAGSTACDAMMIPPWAALPDSPVAYQLLLGDSSAPFLRPAPMRLGEETPIGAGFSMVPVTPLVSGNEPAAESDAVDLLDRVRSMRIRVERDDGTSRTCDRWLFGRWYCGPGDWNYVGAAEVVVRTRTERCIWAHPTDEGDVVAQIDGLPGGASIRGRMAFSDAAADNEAGDSVQFTVRAWNAPDGANTAAIFEREHANRRGWSSWRANLPAGDSVTVEFRISAQNVGQRHFCFTASVRPQAVDAPERIDEAEAEDGSLQQPRSSP